MTRIDEEAQRLTFEYHEAGHLLAGYLMLGYSGSCEIGPAGGVVHYHQQRFDGLSNQQIYLYELMTSVAGEVAVSNMRASRAATRECGYCDSDKAKDAARFLIVTKQGWQGWSSADWLVKAAQLVAGYWLEGVHLYALKRLVGQMERKSWPLWMSAGEVADVVVLQDSTKRWQPVLEEPGWPLRWDAELGTALAAYDARSARVDQAELRRRHTAVDRQLAARTPVEEERPPFYRPPRIYERLAMWGR
jgi:hypothetical protein